MGSRFLYERILCTGANGFLGTALCKRILNMENPLCHELILLDLSAPDYPTSSSSGVKAIPLVCDLNEPNAIDLLKKNNALAGVDGVIHLAGSVHLHPTSVISQCLESFDGNTKIAASLLAILPKDLEYFLYSSTMSVYDVSECSHIEAGNIPVSPTSAYGAGKLAVEKLLNIFGENNKISIGIFRMVSLYGPGNRSPYDTRSIPRFISAALKAKRLDQSEKVSIKGDGKVKTDYLYIEDAVDALIAALERRATVIINLGSGRGISLRDTFEIIKNISGAKLTLEHQKHQGGKDFIFGIRPAQETLNWKPKTSFEVGIANEFRYLSEEEQ